MAKKGLEAASIWKDGLFRTELIATGGLGFLLFFLFHLHDLAQITWIVGAILLFHRYTLIVGFNKTIEPLTERLARLENNTSVIGESIDLALKTSDARDLHDVVDTYFRIVEPELLWHKEEALRSTASELHQLLHDKRSRTMLTAEYYGWLVPKLRSAEPGSEIWAISRMMDGEWDESPEEKEFLDLNLLAARNNVRLTRLFICRAEVWERARTTASVAAQIACSPNLEVYYGDAGEIRRRDAAILAAVGDGMIAFDRSVMLVDQHSEHGMARGYVSASQSEITRMRGYFESLKYMSTRVVET